MAKQKIKESNPMSVQKGEAVFCYIIMAIVCLIALFPIVWVVISSFKADLLAEPGFSLPSRLCFDGYIRVFTKLGIGKYFVNSFITATAGAVLSIAMLSMSAYIIARFNFKGKGLITGCFMATMFVPASALTFPVYNLVKNMGMFDTRMGLIFVYACSGIAVSFMVIRNYFATIPKELEEAAQIDGCTYFQTFTKIMLPIARPGIFTAGVLAWLNLWNEFYWASLLLIDRSKMTVPAILSQFTTSFGTDYNGLLSAVVVTIIPPVILFCCASKFFIEALSGGAVKG
ncbi:MAG: carbohydrate ABC transporter permease [Lachnospiraceae bacterium]|nr:carbohydrate ABC transporter permease [Lachnospiraceae bacterium]